MEAFTGEFPSNLTANTKLGRNMSYNDHYAHVLCSILAKAYQMREILFHCLSYLPKH